jgi:hypothetical protein
MARPLIGHGGIVPELFFVPTWSPLDVAGARILPHPALRRERDGGVGAAALCGDGGRSGCPPCFVRTAIE